MQHWALSIDYTPTAAKAVVAAVAALEAAEAAAVARNEPLLNCGAPLEGDWAAPCSTNAPIWRNCLANALQRLSQQYRECERSTGDVQEWHRMLACSRLRVKPEDARQGAKLLPCGRCKAGSPAVGSV